MRILLFHLLVVLILHTIVTALTKLNQDELKVGKCHGLDFQNCVTSCKGIKSYKDCIYIDKKPKCECEK